MKASSFALLLCLALTALPASGQGRAPATSSLSHPASFDSLIAKAAAARNTERTDEAIRLYRQALGIRPDYAEGWWYLGTLYYGSDQYEEGRRAFQHVTGLKPEMSLGWAMLGLCEFGAKAYEEALAHLQRADRLGIPGQESFYEVSKYHLALLLTRSAKFELAISTLAEFAAQGTDNQDFIEAMGLAALRKPLLPSELPPLERELVMDAGHAMWDAAARRASALGGDLSGLLAKYPSTPQIHFMVGTLELAGNSDQALNDWKAELKISPGHPQALVSIAGEYVKRADYQAALPYAEEAVTAGPREFASHAVLGQVLTEGDLDMPRGIRELEEASHLAPWQAQVHYALAKAYAKAGRKDDSARERAEFLRLRGQSEVAVSKPAK